METRGGTNVRKEDLGFDVAHDPDSGRSTYRACPTLSVVPRQAVVPRPSRPGKEGDETASGFLGFLLE